MAEAQLESITANHPVVVLPTHANPVVTLPVEEKKLSEAYLLGAPLGFLGLHHFYLNRPGFGVLYLFTFGLLGVGWIIDIFRMPFLVKDYNDKQHRHRPGVIETEKKNLSDAYVLMFNPLFGMLGFHHYYLGRWAWGVAYTCTLGLLSIGWFIDLFRLPKLVSKTNAEIIQYVEKNGIKLKKKSEAFLLNVTPLGIFGAHHYYLGRYTWGMVYTFSFGLFGCGWLIDLTRIWILVERANNKLKNPDQIPQKYYDDAYVLWFPFGLFGLHHYYLGRTLWGVLYTCTFGILGIGWLVDLARMPYLVSDANQRIAEEQILTCIITPGSNQVIVARHPPGEVVVSVPTEQVADRGEGSQNAELVLSPPYPGTEQPPSYDSIISSEVGHEAQNATEGGKVNEAYIDDNQINEVKVQSAT